MGIINRLRPGRPSGFDVRKTFSLFSKHKTWLGSLSPIQRVPRKLAQGVKQPRLEADHPPPSTAKIKAWAATYPLSCMTYHYYYYYILQLGFHSVAVVLTLVQTKQTIYINETIQKHSTNNTKHSKYKYTYYQTPTHNKTNTYTHPHITKSTHTHTS